MGGLISSHRYRPGAMSFRFHRPTKQERRRATHPVPKPKRSSANRPVLQLQVKQETIERQRRNRRGLPSGASLGNIPRASGAYDHLLPSAPPPPRRSTSTPALALHHTHRYFTSDTSLVGDSGRESMVMVQFIDNGTYNLSDDKDENDYDTLLPRAEFDHLCECTYKRVDEEDDHLTTLKIGRNGAQVQQLGTINRDELKDRIVQHTPTHPSGHRGYQYTSGPPIGRRRSKSIDATSSYGVGMTGRGRPNRRLAQSTTDINEDIYWSLGESIMKTLSQTGLNVFNIDNPTHESEIEVTRAWPDLKEKLHKLSQSECVEEADEAFVDSDHNLPAICVSNHH